MSFKGTSQQTAAKGITREALERLAKELGLKMREQDEHFVICFVSQGRIYDPDPSIEGADSISVLEPTPLD